MSSGIRSQAHLQVVPLEAVLVLADALQSIGRDVPQALARAGLSHIAWPPRGAIEKPVTRNAFARLAQDAVVAFDAHACRHEGLRSLPYSVFKLMCVAMLAGPDLKTAIGIAADAYAELIDRSGDLRLTVIDDEAILELDLGKRRQDVGNLLVTMYALSTFHRLFGWLTRTQIELTQVTLNYPQSERQPAFDALLQLDPDFDQPRNAIRFAATHLGRPIARQYNELETLLTLFPFDLLPPPYNEQSLIERIESATAAALSGAANPPDSPQLARMFGLSIATLRRRLRADGSSIMQIRNECRTKLAMRLLGSSRLTVKEVAARTGFNDVSSFRRAFRSWTGRSPDAFRKVKSGNRSDGV